MKSGASSTSSVYDFAPGTGVHEKTGGSSGKLSSDAPVGPMGVGAALASLVKVAVLLKGPSLRSVSAPATRQYSVPLGRSTSGVAEREIVVWLYTVEENAGSVEICTWYPVAPATTPQLKTGLVDTVAPSVGAVSVGAADGAAATASGTAAWAVRVAINVATIPATNVLRIGTASPVENLARAGRTPAALRVSIPATFSAGGRSARNASTVRWTRGSPEVVRD